MMRDTPLFSYILNPYPQEPTIEQLVRMREEMADVPERPTGSTYGSLEAGLTQLGRGLAHRFGTMRENRIAGDIEQLDPTGEVVRALMRRQA